jgi:hypothetical protein
MPWREADWRRNEDKSNLERVLEAGHFAVTGELGPPAER